MKKRQAAAERSPRKRNPRIFVSCSALEALQRCSRSPAALLNIRAIGQTGSRKRKHRGSWANGQSGNRDGNSLTIGNAKRAAGPDNLGLSVPDCPIARLPDRNNTQREDGSHGGDFGRTGEGASR